jgi:hypothetical protein
MLSVLTQEGRGRTLTGILEFLGQRTWPTSGVNGHGSRSRLGRDALARI